MLKVAMLNRIFRRPLLTIHMSDNIAWAFFLVATWLLESMVDPLLEKVRFLSRRTVQCHIIHICKRGNDIRENYLAKYQTTTCDLTETTHHSNTN